MLFRAPTRTPPNRLSTPRRLRHQPVLTGPFAVPDIEKSMRLDDKSLNMVYRLSLL